MDAIADPTSPHALWWNKMKSDQRLGCLLARHRGADDPQYQQHMLGFSRRSFSELEWSGQMSVKMLYDFISRME